MSSGSRIEEQGEGSKGKRELRKRKAYDKALQQQAWAAASTSTSKKMRNARTWDDEDEEYPETLSGEKKRLASLVTKRYHLCAVEKSWYERWEKADYPRWMPTA